MCIYIYISLSLYIYIYIYGKLRNTINRRFTKPPFWWPQ